MATFDRSPDKVKILPVLSPIIGETDDEAEAKFEYLQSMIHPVVAREILGTVLGHVDLSPYPLDGPLPDLGETNASKSTLKQFSEIAQKEDRQFWNWPCGWLAREARLWIFVAVATSSIAVA